MGFQTIAVTITDAKGDGPALALAAGMALQEEAHLDVVCVGIDPVRYADMPSGGLVMYDAGPNEAKARAETLQDWVREHLPAELDRLTVQPVVVPQLGLDLMVARLIRYSDLVVAAKPYGKGHSASAVAALDAALIGSGAPVMIAPDRAVDLAKPFARVMVAWNESDEAYSALRKSLPLLQKAEQVDLVLVDPPRHAPERSDPGGAVSLYLARHGVRTEVSILARTLPRVADNLLRFAHDHGVDAIIMGAYGHSRFREALIGGATRDMLEKLDLPVIMAH